MTNRMKRAGLALAAAALAGCVDTGGGSAGDGLSGTQDQFAMMQSPCISQASRVTGASQGSISILDRMRTGGGPILMLNAVGAKYTCRLDDDGSVTVFSAYAN